MTFLSPLNSRNNSRSTRNFNLLNRLVASRTIAISRYLTTCHVKRRREEERNKNRKKRNDPEFNYCSGRREGRLSRQWSKSGLHLSQFRPAGWERQPVYSYVFFSFARRCNLVRVLTAEGDPPYWPIVRLGVNDGIAIIRASFITRAAVIRRFFPSFLARSVPAYSLSRHIIAFITPTPRNCGAPVVLNSRLFASPKNTKIFQRIVTPIVSFSNPWNKECNIFSIRFHFRKLGQNDGDGGFLRDKSTISWTRYFGACTGKEREG